jgi:plastocyanin
LAAIMALFVTALAGSSGRVGEAKFEVSMTDYRFEPDRVVVRPGETVTNTLVNKSRDREHEIMLGREVLMGGPFGDRPEAYRRDFFQGLKVEILSAEGVAMLMTGQARLTGMTGMGGHSSMGGMGGTGSAAMKMGEGHGFMVQLKPGGKATIRFTVPASRAGLWEMGCFAEDGQHYSEGMKGSFVVRG